MHSRKEGLSLAKRARSCPPPGAACVAGEREKYEAHLKICPSCGPHAPAEESAWLDFTQELRRILKPYPAVYEPLLPGQVRPAAVSGVWRGSYHYNPPLVMILEKVNAVADEVLVAQTWIDPVMAGPGDLLLPDDVTPFQGIFVESWNTYTLRSRDLGPVLCRLENEVLEAVRTMAGDHLVYPSWALVPRPFMAADPRIAFRELEVETAYSFSFRAAMELAEIAEVRAALEPPGPEEVREAVVIRFPGTTWRQASLNGRQVAALARFPDEFLPLAADEKEMVQWPATVITLSKEGIKDVYIAACEITAEIRTEDGLEMTGRVRDLPSAGISSEVVVLLESRDGDVIEPETVDWEQRTGLFFARFPVISRRNARFAVAVIAEAREEDSV